jgi:GT2 family glycosyltransferase
MTLPHVSAVVVNYKAYEEAIGCAHGILRQKYPSINVVVVDNASPNESYARLTEAFSSHQAVSVITADRNGGYAAGNNLGARWAVTNSSPQYILIVNPDVELPDPATIKTLVEFAERHEDAAVVGPKVVLPNGRIQGPYKRPSLVWLCAQYLCPVLWLALRSLRQWRIGSIDIPTQCFRTIGACMLIRADDFQTVGMFDEETFLDYEENILAERFLTLRKSFYYVPTVSVIHRHAHDNIGKWTLDSACHYFSNYRGAGPWRLAALSVSYNLYRNFFSAVRKGATPAGNALTAKWQ